MDKLLDIVAKLREVVVPPVPVTKMGKKDLLEFILEDAKLLDRMRTFHDKRKAKAVQSLIHEEQEESVVPTESELKRMTTGQLRRLIREFHKDIGINQKHHKWSASKLRSFISRNKYSDMLDGDEMKFLKTVEEDEPKRDKKAKKEEKKVCTLGEWHADDHYQQRGPSQGGGGGMRLQGLTKGGRRWHHKSACA